AAATAAADDRDLIQVRPRPRPAARVHRGPLRQAHRPDPDPRAERCARPAAAGAPGAVPARQEAEPPLRRTGVDAAAPDPDPRQRPGPRHARLRLLGRERAAPTV